MKDLKAGIWLILALMLIYALISGVTMNGKHYGLRDCNSREGLVIDNGVVPDAGSDAE